MNNLQLKHKIVNSIVDEFAIKTGIDKNNPISFISVVSMLQALQKIRDKYYEKRGKKMSHNLSKFFAKKILYNYKKQYLNE